MMRRWAESYKQESSVAPVAAMSALVHLALIGAWVVATLPADGLPVNSFENRVYYIPPPNPTRGGGGPREVVHFLTFAPSSALSESATRVAGGAPPPTVPTEDAGSVRPEPVADSLPAAPGQQDSVFTILQVDTAVARWASSAAPSYPAELLQAHLSGLVSVRYVVDTTGFADTASFLVLNSTHPGFAAAVRAALPNMRFQPAKIGSLKVRQWVEQQFTFRISDVDTAKVKADSRKPI